MLFSHCPGLRQAVWTIKSSYTRDPDRTEPCASDANTIHCNVDPWVTHDIPLFPDLFVFRVSFTTDQVEQNSRQLKPTTPSK
jgi:hypothetical protein